MSKSQVFARALGGPPEDPPGDPAGSADPFAAIERLFKAAFDRIGAVATRIDALEAMPRPRDGLDGAAADPARLDALGLRIDGILLALAPLSERLAAIEHRPPRDGIDGKDADPARLDEIDQRIDTLLYHRATLTEGFASLDSRLAAFEDRPPPRDGIDGKDADPARLEAIDQRIDELALTTAPLSERLAAIELRAPRDGLDGKDADPARLDALGLRLDGILLGIGPQGERLAAIDGRLLAIENRPPPRDGIDGKNAEPAPPPRPIAKKVVHERDPVTRQIVSSSIVPFDPDRPLAYDPAQPRDDHGRWTSGGSGKAGLANAAERLLSEGSDHSATLAGVMAELSPQAREYVTKTNQRLATVVPTNALVSKGGFKNPDGTWTADRQKVHDEIIAKILTPEAVAAATPANGMRPTYTILGGRGGSGKSWFTGRDGPVDGGHALLIDSDKIKSMLPGYEGWNAGQVHEESTDVFNRIDAGARSLGINVIHDSTMKSGKNSEAFVKAYQDAGYRTEGYYMFLPPEKAARRAVDRANKPGGRYVPPDYVFASRTNEQSFDQIKPSFDKWAIYNNDVPRGVGPQLIAHGGEK